MSNFFIAFFSVFMHNFFYHGSWRAIPLEITFS